MAVPIASPDRSPVRSTIQRRDREGVIRHGAEWLALWSDPDSMRSEAERRRHAADLQRLREEESRLNAAARALSGDPDFQLPDRPPLEAETAPEPFAARRGDGDSAALRKRFHDAALHRRLRPPDPVAARLFDLCERLRCEGLGARRLAGVGRNLAAAQIGRLERLDLLHAHLASLVPLTEGLEMVLRDVFTEAAEPSVASSAFWMWDRWLRSRLLADLLALKEALGDQEANAGRAHRLIEHLFAALDSRRAGERNRLPASRDRGDQSREGGDEGDSGEGHAAEAEDEMMSFEPGAEALGDLDAREAEPPEPAPPVAQPPPYTVFTTAFDRVVDAAEIASPEQLRSLRRRLDEKHEDLRRDVARLAARLQRRLLARRRTSWDFDLEEGLLDAARLDRAIVNPSFALAYKLERESEFRDTVVALLIDNSGSMRSRPIEIACLVADMAAAALERCGVPVEVLGYTTSGWKGGESARLWAESGRPADPGRLNDLRHIVFKSADTPYRRARNTIAAMLEPDHLRENIDGEALQWAAARLRLRPERRRILLVVSDGAPADQATMERNTDRDMLDRHLRAVIAAIERERDITLLAVGVKHDVGRYFRVARVIDRAEALGGAVFSALDAIFQ